MILCPRRVRSAPPTARFRRAARVALRPAGMWNTLELSADADRLTVKINGRVVNEGSGAQRTETPLRLVYRGTEIHFRNVLLRKKG